jgi:hypothetical protein
MNCSNALNSVLYTVEHTVVKRLEGLRLAKRYVLINEPVKLNFLYDGMISDSQLRFGTINVTDLVIKEKSIEAGILNGNICTVFFFGLGRHWKAIIFAFGFRTLSKTRKLIFNYMFF